MKKKIIVATGKRKKAIARATIKDGSGVVRINSKPIENITPRLVRMRIEEPLLLAPKLAKKVNINVNVRGGGISGQADACRTAIANALVKFENDKKLKELFINYDRSLLISDSRRTEPHKPSRSSAGPRRKKQQSKR
ncbi:MAG: 30S ribosomal protein S9 [Candidatus Aenigmarchaeota archaeon]|nr:30S ribosomal protein S9 [Candidatus Aenigmarchaeota archaeon]